MSRATKRKHVTREVEQDLTLPQPGQTIVKVRTPTVLTSSLPSLHFSGHRPVSQQSTVALININQVMPSLPVPSSGHSALLKL